MNSPEWRPQSSARGQALAGQVLADDGVPPILQNGRSGTWWGGTHPSTSSEALDVEGYKRRCCKIRHLFRRRGRLNDGAQVH